MKVRSRPGGRHRALRAVAVLCLAAFARGARAGEASSAPRYEIRISPEEGAESGAVTLASAVTGLAAGEELLFLGKASGDAGAFAAEPRWGPGKIALRSGALLFWDAPVAWWFGTALHEVFGHGGRAREADASPGFHLGSPWGGRDSYATFDLEGTSTEERLLIYAGGTEANSLGATILERRAVEGVRLRPMDLLFLVSNRLVASDYVLRTTPDPTRDPEGFFAEYSGGGDVANYLGLLHDLHGSGSGITSAGSDGTIQREYDRLRSQAFWNLADPGIWWALGSALKMTARGDRSLPLPLPRIGSYRFLPLLSAEWTPSGGEASLEWVMAPEAPLPPAAPGSAGVDFGPPPWFSFVARRGGGPSGSFGALGTACGEIVPAGVFLLGGAAEGWIDPIHGIGGGARLRARLARGSLAGLYFDVGVKSQGYWIGEPAAAGPFGAVGIRLTP
jgi:hypothetical protein